MTAWWLGRYHNLTRHPLLQATGAFPSSEHTLLKVSATAVCRQARAKAGYGADFAKLANASASVG
jgi:hypothetical protein